MISDIKFSVNFRNIQAYVSISLPFISLRTFTMKNKQRTKNQSVFPFASFNFIEFLQIKFCSVKEPVRIKLTFIDDKN